MIESSVPDKSITKLSPFALHKGIMGIAGLVKDVKKLCSGHILVECARKAHADSLRQRSYGNWSPKVYQMFEESWLTLENPWGQIWPNPFLDLGYPLYDSTSQNFTTDIQRVIFDPAREPAGGEWRN